MTPEFWADLRNLALLLFFWVIFGGFFIFVIIDTSKTVFGDDQKTTL